jgi:hypothetical protein
MIIPALEILEHAIALVKENKNKDNKRVYTAFEMRHAYTMGRLKFKFDIDDYNIKEEDFYSTRTNHESNKEIKKRASIIAKDIIDKQIAEAKEYTMTIKKEDQKESDWISVSDRMPEENEHRFSENVLIYYSLGLILIGFTHREFWRSDAQTLKNEEVKYWRHLPEPPKNN